VEEKGDGESGDMEKPGERRRGEGGDVI